MPNPTYNPEFTDFWTGMTGKLPPGFTDNPETGVGGPLYNPDSGGLPGGSSNQYGTLPPTPQVPPGAVPKVTGTAGISGSANFDPSRIKLGGDYNTVSPAFPGFSQDFMQWLMSQMGGGATPFNLATPLPSGGETQAGQLTPGLNPVLQGLLSFFGGVSPQGNKPSLNLRGDMALPPGVDKTKDPVVNPARGYPVSSAGGAAPAWLAPLVQMAQTGDPTNAVPAWQAMVDAAQRNIQENAANLKEQFNFSGNLSSSPMANAMTDYYTQASKDQNAALLQAVQQALESAAGRKLTAGQDVAGMGASFGNALQGLDQNAIAQIYSEFVRTQPEYNPLLSMMFSGATTFPPVYSSKYGMGVGGALLQNAGSIASGVADLYTAIKGTGGGNNSPLPTGGGGSNQDPLAFSGFGFGG